MKHKTSKLWSILLAIVMMVGLLPATAMAAEVKAGVAYPVDDGNGYIYFDKKTGAIVDCDEWVSEVVIPEEIDGVPVTSIESYAFDECSLYSLYIPGSVKCIKRDAVRFCDKLKDVTIAEGVEEIEALAFNFIINTDSEHDASGVSIHIPASVKKMGENPFGSLSGLSEFTVDEGNAYYMAKDGVLFSKDGTLLLQYPCDKLDSYTVPEGTKRIEACAFQNAKLESVSLPESLEEIGADALAFNNFCSQTTLTIPAGVKSIEFPFSTHNKLEKISVAEGNAVYYDVDGVLFAREPRALLAYPSGKTDSSYSIPDGVEIICRCAISDIDLTELRIPDSVKEIQEEAIWCRAETIRIPKNVERMEGNPFSRQKLKKIELDPENQWFTVKDDVLFTKDMKRLVAYPCGKTDTVYTIPEGVEVIGGLAFESVGLGDALQNVNFPTTLKEVGWRAFNYARNLKEIRLPEGVKSIGTLAFCNCESVKEVYIPSTMEKIENNAFLMQNGSALTDVYYNGSKGQWTKIEIEKGGNKVLREAEIHFNSDGLVEKTDRYTDVSIEAPAGVLAESAELVVVEKTPEEEGIFALYDIYFIQDGEKVQPEGEVTVSLPVPEGMDAGSCKVFYIADDGTKTDMNATYINGYLVFTATHFSLYAVVDKSFSADDDDPSEKEEQTITASDITTAYGAKNIRINASAVGALTYEVETGEDVISVDDKGAVTIQKAGRATVKITAAETDTYKSAEKTIFVTVDKAKVTIAAKNKTAKINDAVPVLGENDYTISGLINGDTLSQKPTIAYASEPDMSKAGTIDILLSGADAGENYDIVYKNGVLTVKASSGGGGSGGSGGSGGGGGGGASAYAVEVAKGENGSVTASPTSAKTGDKVTLTPKPAEGYETDKITVTDKNGKEVAVTKNSDGTYSFTMPSSKVSVKPAFKEVTDIVPEEEAPLLVVSINSMTYRLNGKTMTMDSAPFIDGNNRTMLPVRVIANALGITNENIKWDSATKTASFTRADGKVVSCTINSNVIKIGDEEVTIDTVPVIRNDRIYLPMRALFNAFNVPDENILWDAAARTVTVTKKD